MLRQIKILCRLGCVRKRVAGHICGYGEVRNRKPRRDNEEKCGGEEKWQKSKRSHSLFQLNAHTHCRPKRSRLRQPRNEPTATLADFFSCPRLGLLFFPLSFASLLLCLLRVPPKNSLAANNVEAVSSTHCTRLPLAQSPVSSRARLNDANIAGWPRRLPTVLLQPANTPMQCRVF